MTTALVGPAVPRGVGQVAEERLAGTAAVYAHDAWADESDWLVHGVTGNEADMSLFGGAPAGEVLERWKVLRRALGCRTMVHARQVHGGDVHVHARLPEGVFIAPDADGHATSDGGTLLGVSVADCVPVYLAAREVAAVALLHAGWRGVAAGIVEHGVRALVAGYGAVPATLLVHCGPAICGECYAVGAEVPQQLGIAGSPRHLDLRAVIAHRLIDVGVPAARITISAHCTRHGGAPFYSHRAGCAERQLGLLAVRPRT